MKWKARFLRINRRPGFTDKRYFLPGDLLDHRVEVAKLRDGNYAAPRTAFRYLVPSEILCRNDEGIFLCTLKSGSRNQKYNITRNSVRKQVRHRNHLSVGPVTRVPGGSTRAAITPLLRGKHRLVIFGDAFALPLAVAPIGWIPIDVVNGEIRCSYNRLPEIPQVGPDFANKEWLPVNNDAPRTDPRRRCSPFWRSCDKLDLLRVARMLYTSPTE